MKLAIHSDACARRIFRLVIAQYILVLLLLVVWMTFALWDSGWGSVSLKALTPALIIWLVNSVVLIGFIAVALTSKVSDSIAQQASFHSATRLALISAICAIASGIWIVLVVMGYSCAGGMGAC